MHAAGGGITRVHGWHVLRWYDKQIWWWSKLSCASMSVLLIVKTHFIEKWTNVAREWAHECTFDEWSLCYNISISLTRLPRDINLLVETEPRSVGYVDMFKFHHFPSSIPVAVNYPIWAQYFSDWRCILSDRQFNAQEQRNTLRSSAILFGNCFLVCYVLPSILELHFNLYI